MAAIIVSFRDYLVLLKHKMVPLKNFADILIQTCNTRIF